MSHTTEPLYDKTIKNKIFAVIFFFIFSAGTYYFSEVLAFSKAQQFYKHPCYNNTVQWETHIRPSFNHLEFILYNNYFNYYWNHNTFKKVEKELFMITSDCHSSSPLTYLPLKYEIILGSMVGNRSLETFYQPINIKVFEKRTKSHIAVPIFPFIVELDSDAYRKLDCSLKSDRICGRCFKCFYLLSANALLKYEDNHWTTVPNSIGIQSKSLADSKYYIFGSNKTDVVGIYKKIEMEIEINGFQHDFGDVLMTLRHLDDPYLRDDAVKIETETEMESSRVIFWILYLIPLVVYLILFLIM